MLSDHLGYVGVYPAIPLKKINVEISLSPHAHLQVPVSNSLHGLNIDSCSKYDCFGNILQLVN